MKRYLIRPAGFDAVRVAGWVHRAYSATGPLVPIAIFTFYWLGAVADASWRFDDGFHLDFARHVSPWQYFFDPSITRAQSGAHITPWNTLFYDINIALFGANPALYYLHLLAVILATALLAFAICRTFAAVLPSLCAALIYLAGAPTFQVVNELMSGHYAYGLLFAAAATLSFIRYRKGGSVAWLATSSLLYLAACACKEVFTPLPLLLVALPSRLSLRRRIVDMLPFAAVAVCYLGWRFAVLGTIIGGYPRGSSLVATPLLQLVEVPRLLSAAPAWTALRPIMLTTALAVGMLAVLWARGRQGATLLAAGVIAASLPLYMLASMQLLDSPGRYLYAPWFLASLLLGFLVAKAPFGKYGQTVVAIPLIMIAAVSTSAHRPVSAAEAHASEALYSAIAARNPDELILLPADTLHPLMFQLFAFAYAEITQSPYRQDLLITSSKRLCDALAAGKRVLAYDPETKGFTDAPPDRLWNTAAALDARYHACLHPALLRPQPLSVQIEFTDGFLEWQLGPYADGSWHYLFDELPICPPTRRRGRYPLAARPMTLRFLYTSPQGWISVTPALQIRPDQGTTIAWEGVAMPRIETVTRSQCADRIAREDAREPL